MAHRFEVQAAIICEDIRGEVNNKFTLTGVFGTEINIAIIPGAINLALYSELFANTLGPFESQMRLMDPAGDNLVQGKVLGEILKVGGMMLPLGPFPTVLKRAGRYEFQLKFEDTDWYTVRYFTLNLDASLAQKSFAGIPVIREQRPSSEATVS